MPVNCLASHRLLNSAQASASQSLSPRTNMPKCHPVSSPRATCPRPTPSLIWINPWWPTIPATPVLTAIVLFNLSHKFLSPPNACNWITQCYASRSSFVLLEPVSHQSTHETHLSELSCRIHPTRHMKVSPSSISKLKHTHDYKNIFL